MDPVGLRGRRRKKRGQEFSFLVVCRLFCFVWPFFLLSSLLLINLDNISNYSLCVYIKLPTTLVFLVLHFVFWQKCRKQRIFEKARSYNQFAENVAVSRPTPRRDGGGFVV